MMTPRPINPEEGQEIPQEDARTPSQNVPLQDQRMSRRGALGRILGFGAVAGAASLGLGMSAREARGQDLTEEQILGKDTEEGKQAIENLEQAKENRQEARETLTEQQGADGLGGMLWKQAMNATGEGIMNALAPAAAKAAKDLGGMRAHIKLYERGLIREMEAMHDQVHADNQLSPTDAEIDQELARLQEALEETARACAKGWNGSTDAIAAISVAYGLIGRLPARLQEFNIGGFIGNLAVNLAIAKKLILKNKDLYLDDETKLIDKAVEKATKSGKRKLARIAEQVKADNADTPDAATRENRQARQQQQADERAEVQRQATQREEAERAEQQRLAEENAQRRTEIADRLRGRYPMLSEDEIQAFVDREMNDED